MAGPIILEKNKIDLDQPNVTLSVTDGVASDPGDTFLDLLRNRKNTNGWGTGGSSDAGLTTIEIDTGDEIDVTDVFFVRHNMKSYMFKYWNGSAWTAFSSAIAPTTNTETTTHHNFTEVTASRFQLVISGTMTPDQDKLMSQIILTKRIGQFTAQPMIGKPRHERGRKVRKMLSGRANITRSTGSFSCSLRFPPNKTAADHAIIERMFDSFNGFLVWLNAGDDSQFFTDVQGFRKEDIYLMACANDLEPEWVDGRFSSGQAIEISLVESRI